MPQDTPLFSILMASYNNAHFLEEALESVFTQDYTNWEIIIVDDGSTDNSEDIYKKYAGHPRIKVSYNGKNEGCGYTKRRCAELATGEICGFLDPDDALLPDALSASVVKHLENPDVSVVHSKCRYCNKKLKKRKKVNIIPEFKEGECYFDYRQLGPWHFTSYKNAYYKLTEGISPVYKAGVDQDLCFKLEEVGRPAILDRITYLYRSNPASVSKDRVNTYYWNLVVRHDTCVRRGIKDPLIYLEDDIKQYFRYCIIRGGVIVKHTQPYHTVYILTKAFRPISRLFKKKKS